MSLRTSVVTSLAIGTLLVAGGYRLQAQAGQYAKTVEIPIGGSAGFDYLYADSVGKRLYVSHGMEAVVIDTSTNTVVGRVTDTPGIHGIAIANDLGRGFTSNGSEDKVSIFDLKTLQTLSKVDTGGKNPDAITYDAKHKEVWAFNHTGKSAAEIDGATGKMVATIPLSGTAETGAADAGLDRVFVNIEDTNSIDVIDIAMHKVIANWPVAPATGPTGMANDAVTHRIFVGGGPSMVMIDANSGKVVASAPICMGTDATWYDSVAKMAFSSCSDGKITAVKVDGDKLTVVQTIDTEPRARTMAGDSVTHKLYVVAVKPDPNAPPPAPGSRGRGASALPDSFHASVFEMKK